MYSDDEYDYPPLTEEELKQANLLYHQCEINYKNVRKLHRSQSIDFTDAKKIPIVSTVSTRRHSLTQWTDINIQKWAQCDFCRHIFAPGYLGGRAVEDTIMLSCTKCTEKDYKCYRCGELSLDDAGWCSTRYCDPELW